MANDKKILIVASKAKEYIKENGCMTSGDAIDSLNNKVHELIDSALDRTKANKRSTVRSHDF